MPVLNTGLPPAQYIETEEQARDLLRHVMKLDYTGLDTETTGLDNIRDVVVLWSLSDGKGRWAIDAQFLDVFNPYFECETNTKILTNAKFDKHMLANSGIDLRGTLWDTVVMSWLLDVNGRHDLKSDTTKKYRLLPPEAMPSFAATFLTTIDSKTGKPKKRNMKAGETVGDIVVSFLHGTPEQQEIAVDYASKDAWASYELAWKLKADLETLYFGEDWTAWDHYVDIEVPFTHVLWRCERRGITVDAGQLLDMSPSFVSRINGMEREFAKLAGHVVNLKSPDQLREIFYFYDEEKDEWLDPWWKPCRFWTPGGKSGVRKPSTDKRTLEKWADQGLEEAQLLINHRSLSKLYDTYIKKLPLILDNEMRCHTNLNQAGTGTGRLSSNDPNLQNIPVRSEEGAKIREAFVAAPGKRLLVYDYSQLEMRILAHMAEDQGMIESIKNGLDIHCDTAARINRRPYSEYAEAKKAEHPTPEQVKRLRERSICKNAGFLIVYGGGPGKLSVTAGIPVQQAKTAIEEFRAARPGIDRYTKEMVSFARRHRFVETLAGRHRNLPFIDSDQDQGHSKRAAVNTPIQGSAADIIKAAMLKLAAKEDPRFRETAEELESYGCEMLMQVHDELIFEIPDDDEVEAAVTPIIIDAMEHPFNEPLSVALTVGGGSGYTWKDAK